jgi:hypothetical protein
MTIETKYKIGDEVYTIHNNRFTKVKIAEVKAHVSTFANNDYNRSFQKTEYGWIGLGAMIQEGVHYFNEEDCWLSPEDFVDKP